MKNRADDQIAMEKPSTLFGPMDRTFLIMRITVVLGGLGWLSFVPLSRDEKIQALLVFVFFSFYTAALYVTIFFNLEQIRKFYLVGLLFDLIFVFLLLMLTGGAASSFFIGFYILVALHSFYYGLTVGLAVSLASSIIYYISYQKSGFPIHWTDFSIRIFFLFFLSVSAGLLTGMMKKDRERIHQLNRKLQVSIADLEKAQKKLIETEKLTALGRMTSDVAHEIRNPLVTIGGFARRCNAKIDPGLPEKKYSRIIVDEVSRLEKILRDLLTFSKGPPRKPEEFAIPPALEKSLWALKEEIEEKKIRVVQEFADDLPGILGDSEQLEQVFINIMLNAVEAMSADGVLTLRVYAKTREDERFLCVEIKDTGAGIPDEIRELIFNPFFSTKDQGKGTGLGLSVSRRIVEEHNGRIEVDSEVWKGTTFTILFPVSSPETEAAQALEEDGE